MNILYQHVSLDFCLPSKFNLTYIDKDGQRKTPVVLHRAILGSLDRFMAYILEETKGNLPSWLAPEQVRASPFLLRLTMRNSQLTLTKFTTSYLTRM